MVAAMDVAMWLLIVGWVGESFEALHFLDT
jgi:hypothetical protein